MTEYRKPYPVRVDASLDESLSRGLWLVKWLLLIPHLVVLVFLWLGLAVITVLAFVAVLVTGRYPRGLFDYAVGVLRWTWRVQYYGYGALGTDRYPPFTLAEVPGYPAHFDVAYPERLSRGLVLVKWLLAVPHYVVVGVFVGGGIWIGNGAGGRWDDGWDFGGLVGVLVLVAGIVLLFAGRYPRPIYDFVLGMNRWVLRVGAYVALLTDAYPPFRLDMGGTDPGSTPAGPLPAGPAGSGALPGGPSPTPAPVSSPAASSSGYAAHSTSHSTGHSTGHFTSHSTGHFSWPAGRVVTLLVGALLLATATGFVGAGGTLLWADATQRDDGWLTSPDATLLSSRYAVTTESLRLEGDGLDWVVDDLLGTARIEVTPAETGEAVFVGIGRSADVARYLDGVGRSELDGLAIRDDGDRQLLRDLTDVAGGAPATVPDTAGVWTAASSGSGTQVLDWSATEGDWTVVVMRADGGAGVRAEVAVAATLPGLTWFAWVLLGVGVLIGAAGTLLVVLAARGARPTPPSGGDPAERIPPLPSGPTAPEPTPALVGPIHPAP